MPSDGDFEARFEEILEETQLAVRAYIAGMGVSPDDVDDVTQDVYVEFYREEGKLPPDTTAVQWLKGIARNLCFAHFKKAKRHSEHFAALAEILEQLPEPQETPAGGDSYRDALLHCLSKLSDRHRELVNLRFRKNLPAKTIAERVKSTEQAVRVILFRVRKALKECISREVAREAG
jgi:RNA polymerase sigma-70 factor (ECF subfamily)